MGRTGLEGPALSACELICASPSDEALLFGGIANRSFKNCREGSAMRFKGASGISDPLAPYAAVYMIMSFIIYRKARESTASNLDCRCELQRATSSAS